MRYKLLCILLISITFFSCNDGDDLYIPLDVAEGEFSWKGKHILWLGTSIPEGGGSKSYPAFVAGRFGATVHNESVGGSTIRAFLYHGSFKDMPWMPVSRALSQTVAEKKLLAQYFYSGLDENGAITPGGTYGWRDLCPGAPRELADEALNLMLDLSYERKLVNKYLDPKHPDFIVRPDVIVIDHGYNDVAHGLYDNYNNAESVAVPDDVYDRRRYIGATNYIIKVIRDYYPDQKIILMGHFENEYVPSIHQAQLNLFDYWKDEYPSFKLWEVLGWTQEINPETGLTYLQTNCPDNLHPHTDERIDKETGYRMAIKQIGEACYNYFKELYK